MSEYFRYGARNVKSPLVLDNLLDMLLANAGLECIRFLHPEALRSEYFPIIFLWSRRSPDLQLGLVDAEEMRDFERESADDIMLSDSSKAAKERQAEQQKRIEDWELSR